MNKISEKVYELPIWKYLFLTLCKSGFFMDYCGWKSELTNNFCEILSSFLLIKSISLCLDIWSKTGRQTDRQTWLPRNTSSFCLVKNALKLVCGRKMFDNEFMGQEGCNIDIILHKLQQKRRDLESSTGKCFRILWRNAIRDMNGLKLKVMGLNTIKGKIVYVRSLSLLAAYYSCPPRDILNEVLSLTMRLCRK